jgi:colanic acid biosynthesis glycosyl transferase WcaI
MVWKVVDMRILIVTQYFWPEPFRINDLALGLRERGHDVVVLTGTPNYPAGTFFPNYGFFGRARDDFQGIPVVRVPLIPRGNGGKLRLALNYLSFALFASVLAPFRCRGGFDAIFVFEPSPITVGLPALVLKKFKKAPLLFWVQDLWPESLSATGAVRTRWILRAVERLVRFIYRHCDRILVQSRAFAAPIAALGVDPEHIYYFPNSAEALYRPVEPVRDMKAAVDMPQGFRIMFAGNVGAAQDFATIIEAARQLKAHKDIHWIVLGDGRMRDWVSSQIEAHGLQSTVHLLGRHAMEEMPAFFALADVMLVTLRRDPIFALTIPAKVQSYLACAKPILAALEGEGARVIVEAGAGIAVPSENPAALANAVLELVDMSREERQAMGLRGRNYFEQHFERERLLNKLDGWMATLKSATRCAS